MLSGGTATTRDVLPWFVVTATNIAASLNMIGMRRQGLTRDEIETVRWVFKTINRRGLSLPTALEAIRDRGRRNPDERVIKRFTTFFDRSERPICTAFAGRPRSGYVVNEKM